MNKLRRKNINRIKSPEKWTHSKKNLYAYVPTLVIIKFYKIEIIEIYETYLFKS